MKSIDLDKLDALWEQQERLHFLLQALVVFQNEPETKTKTALTEQGIFWLMLEFETLRAQLETL